MKEEMEFHHFFLFNKTHKELIYFKRLVSEIWHFFKDESEAGVIFVYRLWYLWLLFVPSSIIIFQQKAHDDTYILLNQVYSTSLPSNAGILYLSTPEYHPNSTYNSSPYFQLSNALSLPHSPNCSSISLPKLHS